MAEKKKQPARPFQLQRYIVIAAVCFLIVYGAHWVKSLQNDFIAVPTVEGKDWRSFCEIVRKKGIDCVVVENPQGVEVPEDDVDQARELLEAFVQPSK